MNNTQEHVAGSSPAPCWAVEKPNLSISFSGGRTSGMMLALCLRKFGDSHNIRIVFANTGCEHPATLDFVDRCDREIANGRIVWLEAEVDPIDGNGIRHRVVDYHTASRDGKPFNDAIAKYGIPNRTNPWCTGRLKTDVMNHYHSANGWMRGKRLNYTTAIGIRADERDRVSQNAESQGWVYPLIDMGITKGQVIEYWKRQDFDLRIPGEHYGNCVWCWKKSLRKLMTIAKYTPQWFDFPSEMEYLYGSVKADAACAKDGKRSFFDKYRSSEDIIKLAYGQFREFIDMRQTSLLDFAFDPDLDAGGGCGESCEIGTDSADLEASLLPNSIVQRNDSADPIVTRNEPTVGDEGKRGSGVGE